MSLGRKNTCSVVPWLSAAYENTLWHELSKNGQLASSRETSLYGRAFIAFYTVQIGVLWFAYFLVSSILVTLSLRSKRFITQRAAPHWAISTLLCFFFFDTQNSVPFILQCIGRGANAIRTGDRTQNVGVNLVGSNSLGGQTFINSATIVLT